MKFLHPEFMYYMLIPLTILFALLLTQKEAVGTFFSDEVMEKLRVVANTLTLKARNALFYVAGVFMVVALAEPVIVDGKIEVRQKSADILVALDISNSMLARDVYPNRLEFAKKKALGFIKKIQEDRVGVVAFANASYLVSPLSHDKEAVAFLLQNLDTTSITEQGTSFLALLDTVHKSSKKSKKKYLLLLSDGGDNKDFSKEIQKAKELGITVFVLGIGTKKGSPIPLQNGAFMRYKGSMVITKLNPAIASLATQSGGVYIKATLSDKDIKAMFDEMQKKVTKEELKAKTIQKYIPLFYFPLGMAMIFILIALSSMSKRVKVEVPSAFIVGFFLLYAPQAKASLLDFQTINQAKEYYNKGEYEKAGKTYEKYAKSSNKARGYYDAGGCYYKAGKYQKALGMYKKVHTKEHTLMAHNFYNMGNAYAKLGRYKEALESYKDSLKLQEDKEARENLEAVKKLLQEQNQKKQQNRTNNQNEKKNNQNQSQNQQSKEQKNNKQQSNNSASKAKQKENSSGTKEQNKNQDSSHKQQQNKENKNKKSNKNNHSNKQQSTSNKENNTSNEQNSTTLPLEHKEHLMSDAEEKKWFGEINKKTKTFLYRMQTNSNNRIEKDEKPW